MITIEAFSPGGKDPIVMEASRVLIKTANGNPLCLVVTWGDKGQYLHADYEDKDFDAMLQTFGVDAAVVLKKVKI
jgi:hypothetical protein